MHWSPYLISEQSKRDHNEDCGLVLTSDYHGHHSTLMAVCDGVGGNDNGDLASRACARVLSRLFSSVCCDDELLAIAEWSELYGRIQELIKVNAIEIKKELECVAKTTNSSSLASTLVAALIVRDHLVYWWLGDSRAYIFRDGRMKRLTTDHSYVEESLALDEAKALESARRNVITKFFSVDNIHEPEIQFQLLNARDLVVLTSDGVHGCTMPWDFERGIAYYLLREINSEELCHSVFDYLRPNFSDNATMCVAMGEQPLVIGTCQTVLSSSSFRQQDIKNELVDAMNYLPSNIHEFSARSDFPWASAMVPQKTAPPKNIASCRIRLTPRKELTAPLLVCLSCGSRMSQCGCDNPSPHRGWWADVTSPVGKISRVPINDGAELTIGQSEWPGTDVGLEDRLISPYHLDIRSQGGVLSVKDNDSDNGSWLSLRRETNLKPGDVLRIGRHFVTFLKTENVESSRQKTESTTAEKRGGVEFSAASTEQNSIGQATEGKLD